MTGPEGPAPRPGRRALFSDPTADPGPPGPAGGRPGRRALFSDPDPAGAGRSDAEDIHAGPTTAVVECRTCLHRTPMSLLGMGLSLAASLWLPTRPWPRLMRCPACQRVSWCRIEWPRLRGSD